MGTPMNAILSLRKNEGKGYTVRVILSYNQRKLAVSTNVFVMNAAHFNKNLFLSKDEPDYKIKNLKLGTIICKVRRFILDYNPLPEKDSFLENKVISIVKGKEKEEIKTFIDYIDEYIALKSNDGTKSVYEQTKRKILLFDPDCTFESMDRKWLTEFEKWMAQTMKINAYAIHLRNIRAVFNYAIDEEITTLYPFRKFKIKHEETRKRCLTVEQLRILRDYPVEEYQEKYRDMFMLMFYLIGINAADLFSLTDITPDGRIEYYRAKTHRLYSIKVESEAMEIINKYKGRKYLLNVLDDYRNYKDFLHHMNDELKKIGKVERSGRGGAKTLSPLFPDLSSYWSRHTWATFAAELDISKETIGKALGHADSSVTDIYINFDQTKIDDANRKVIDYLNN